jgi:hypothetical protein
MFWKTGFVVCSPLRDGRPLPVYIVLAFANLFEHGWVPHVIFDSIFEKVGKAIPWRYFNNVKGLVNEEFCAIYIKDITCPLFGYPERKVIYSFQRDVIICDGVDAYFAYSVAKKAVDTGMEIELKIPHITCVF